jgi:hypothetical protein
LRLPVASHDFSKVRYKERAVRFIGLAPYDFVALVELVEIERAEREGEGVEERTEFHCLISSRLLQ